jgi:hypothetical protein
MTLDKSKYGMKVSKVAKEITSTDIRDFILHTDYPMFKLHETKTGSITINAGGTTGTFTVTHDLGYVPSFLVYENNSLFPSDVNCYATSTGITVTKVLSSPYNQTITEYTGKQAVFEDSLPSYYIIAGQKLTSGTGSAIRFEDIAIAQGQTVTDAEFEWKNVETNAGADIKFKIWGIDQDNCTSFSDYGDANGRSKTDVVNTKTQSPITSKFNFGDNWTNLCQEIVNRAGWSSGNDMGFVFNDNDTTDGHVLVYDTSGSGLSDIILTITLTGTGSITYNYKVIIFKDKIA